MKIAVVDDERPARSELKYLISQCEPNTEIAEADDSETFLEMLDSESVDVCFVDKYNVTFLITEIREYLTNLGILLTLLSICTITFRRA